MMSEALCSSTKGELCSVTCLGNQSVVVLTVALYSDCIYSRTWY